MNNNTSTNSVTSSIIDEFMINLKMTKGIRYLMYFRLEKKDRLASIMVAVLSFLAIASSLIEWHIRSEHNTMEGLDRYTLLTILASIFILVVSQYEYGKGYRVRAQIFLHSALDIENLQKRLQSLIDSKALTFDELNNLNEKYIVLLHKTPAPHEPVDYAHFKYCHPRSYPTKYDTNTIGKWIYIHIYGRLLYFKDVYLYPILMVLAPMIFSYLFSKGVLQGL
jgi:hypothetical protein